MRKKTLRLLALLLCLLLFSGSAAGDVTTVATGYVAETVLYGQAMCPTLLPGSEDGSVVVRWAAMNNRPVVIHYGADDGSGVLGEDHRTEKAQSAYSAMLGLHVYSAKIQLEPGDYIYGLAEEGADMPERFYHLHWRTGESFRVVMSSDSHMYNWKEAALYDNAIISGSGARDADMIIHTGDLNDNTKAPPYVLSVCSAHTRVVPTLAICGNHDVPEIIYAFFTPPNLDRQTKDFWTVQNNILFLGININERNMEEHRRYLTQAITEHREGCDWTVLLIHYSMMSNGVHGKDQPVYNFREGLRDLIAEYDVDLVLSGHDHEYDRSYLIGATDMVEGSGGSVVKKRPGETLYLSLPTAVGNKLYSDSREPVYPLAVEGPQTERGYVTADFSSDGITFTAWCAGEDTDFIVDRFVLRRA
ncbi:MAG: metallophosphoesterase [Oscillospiraceae bacterium]|nr:metallophosphoesterase [Oscillospiraceae bacterium]